VRFCVNFVSVDLDLLPRHVVNSALRLNLPYFAFGCIIAVGGACSLVLARLRSRDRLLLWVGVFSLLYAARLFVQNELVRAAFNAPGTEYVPFALAITFTINVPFALFALELIGHGWKASIAIWVWSCGVFAVIAILATLFARDLRWVNLANGVLVVGGTLLLLAHMFLGTEPGTALDQLFRQIAAGDPQDDLTAVLVRFD